MTRTSGARVLAEMLDAYGVTHVFMVPAARRPAVIDVVTDIDAAAPLAWDAEDRVQRY